MNAILQAQLDRLESAFNALSDSITSYNPSVPAAQDLLAADAVFSQGIDQLVRHQQNHARLLSLRAKADALSSSLHSSLALLAETRSAILSSTVPVLSPSTLPSSSSSSFAPSGALAEPTRTAPGPKPIVRRPVPHAELLAVAHNQARFAAPISFVPPPKKEEEEQQQQSQSQPQNQNAPPTQSQSQSQQATQAIQNASVSFALTPTQSQTQGQTQTQSQLQTQDTELATQLALLPSSSSEQQQQQQHGLDPQTQTQMHHAASFATTTGTAGTATTNPGLSLLEDAEKLWLDPVTQTPYLPWPAEAMVARSALGRVQGWGGAVVVPSATEEEGMGAGAGGEEQGEGRKEKEGKMMEGGRGEEEKKDATRIGGGEDEAGTAKKGEGGGDGKWEKMEGVVVQGSSGSGIGGENGVMGSSSEENGGAKREEGRAPAPAPAPAEEKPKVFMGLDMYDGDDD